MIEEIKKLNELKKEYIWQGSNLWDYEGKNIIKSWLKESFKKKIEELEKNQMILPEEEELRIFELKEFYKQLTGEDLGG